MGNNTQLDDWRLEQEEWLEALEEVIESQGKEKSAELFQRLRYLLARHGAANGGPALNTPYKNTIPPDAQPEYPGDLELERRIENVIRWNAQAMVLQAQDKNLALGGHIATFAACATMLEVLFHHFLRKRSAEYGGDLFMFQGHASPGIYARAVWEGRLDLQQIADFRQELLHGVSSYPHPRRMPKFWQAPTVSMGLGPMTAVYQARFYKYLETRGLKPKNGGKVWHYIGDGEIDEPEIYGTIGVASRENLDNLIFVVHCNLQRLDGPVRGNGKIIQEVERHFYGASWDVIKVVWGSEWDELLAKDEDGVLLARLEQMVDGDFQEITNLDGAGVRKKIVGDDERIAALLADYSDDQLKAMRRGGHDALKVYAAYEQAVRSNKPVAIIVQTVKGYGMGKAAEGKNKAHQTKDISADARVETKNRYEIPISDEEAKAAKFWYPGPDDPATKYLLEHRKALGGFLPERSEDYPQLELPDVALFEKQLQGSESAGGKAFSTTAAMIDIMTQLIRNKEVGKYIVPIVPDEAQTFGMEPLFNSAQIWNQKGQLYTPLEIGISVIKYKESVTGQVLQEGINEDGATASFTAAGTAYSNHGIPTIPFYIYYSMFGFQRVGDLVWAAADMMCKGFLLGATAGRTTLNGEGLQHQDGHSHLIAQTVPAVISYDPAFAYELAVIVHDGIRRMYVEHEHKMYYITLYNENLPMPAMPKGVEEGIKRGIYRYQQSKKNSAKAGIKAHLLASGIIMDQALQAAEILESEGVSTDIWSATSWSELYRDANACDRWNMLHPGEKEKVPYLQQVLKGEDGVFVAASDWVKLTKGCLAPWMPADFTVLGTDGFGLSESRESLRDYFQVSAKYIAFAAVQLLHRQGKVSDKAVKDFMKKYEIAADTVDPMSI
ncbi:MAG: pyruvate dehydrogenase (acetyl-transferring), homodimeric type [Lewinellaceae bacterium]|nr:pyruvate dehydrogenase (acetyl-transferring), homodimeric type [Saprospiraceae bacterium]MCB9334069.1 pyruvate dehydrogenase (acetyl-transferring), homodimeric type [Lewinellaceae bacterium]